MSVYRKEFSELLNEILTNWVNALPLADSSSGSMLRIQSEVLAAAILGLYEEMEFRGRQVLPTTQTEGNLSQYAAVFDQTQRADETASEFRLRFLQYLAQKPAGGSRLDYQREAEAVSGVDSASVFGPDEGQAVGNVLVVVKSDGTEGTSDATEANKLHDADGGFVVGMVGSTVTQGGDTATITGFVDSGELDIDTDIIVSGEAYTINSPVPSTILVAAVQTAIDAFKPITDTAVVSGAETSAAQTVSITVTGEDVDSNNIEDGITEYINNIEIGGTLRRDQIISIAVGGGAETVVVNTPASDVSAGSQKHIHVAGTITITVS